jgi:hypothetical protein
MDTLFGWPQAPTVTPLELLGLLGGIPLVVIVVVFAIAKGHAVLQVSKHGPGPRPDDPVWMGGRARSIMGGAEDQLTIEEAATRQAQLEASPSTPTVEADAGGASARW